jgi:hypothetical protein
MAVFVRGGCLACSILCENADKPGSPPVPPALRQGEFGMSFDSGIEPGSGVAKAFTEVVLQVSPSPDLRFPAFRGFPQFAPRARLKFSSDQIRVFGPQPVTQACPDEMKNLMDQDQAKLPGLAE